MALLSAVLIVKNEEKNIVECLRRLAFCGEIVVVDSGSADRTVSLAKDLGAAVYSNPFVDYASQKNFAIGKASSDWVFLIDADERVSDELAREIIEILKHPTADGYLVKRMNRIFGRWMKHGANRDDFQLRLVRRQKAMFDGCVHERIRLEGPCPRLSNVLRHHSTESVSSYMKKLNLYTSLEVKVLEERHASTAAGKMKTRPLQFFFYRAFWQRGLRDGMEGFLFCILSAYYEFIRQAKHWGKQRDKKVI